MSLINQMLRDLEKRTHDNISQQPLDIKVIKPNAEKSVWFFLIIALSALLSAFFIYQHYYSTNGPIKDQQLIANREPEVIQQSLQAKTKPLPLPVPTVEKIDKVPPVEKKPVKTVSQKKTDIEQIQKQADTEQIVTEKSPVIKRLSPREQAEKLFQQAQQTNLSSTAQSHLQQALTLNPMHIKARVLLAQILLQQGLTQQTANFLDQSLQLFPENLLFIKTRAQIYLQQKNHTAALKILSSIEPATISDLTYLSLLAAAYQQQGNFKQSADMYQRLVSLTPETAEYWLGLAIALENTDQKQQAISAYQRAIEKNTLKPAILSYIKQRMIALR